MDKKYRAEARLLLQTAIVLIISSLLAIAFNHRHEIGALLGGG